VNRHQIGFSQPLLYSNMKETCFY